MIDKPLAYRRAVDRSGNLVAVFDVVADEGTIRIRYDEAAKTVDGDSAGMAQYVWSADSLADLRELLLAKFSGTALEDDARAVFADAAAMLLAR
jgi:hypothetical protein